MENSNLEKSQEVAVEEMQKEEISSGIILSIVSDWERALLISLPEKELQKASKKELEKIRQDLTLPGFRKGKVPLSMLGSQHSQKAFEQAVYLKIDAYLEENIFPILKDDFLGIISLNLKEHDTNMELYHYDLRFEVQPQLEKISIPQNIEVKCLEIAPLTEVSDLFIRSLFATLGRHCEERLEGDIEISDVILVQRFEENKEEEPSEDFKISVARLFAPNGSYEALAQKILHSSVGDRVDFIPSTNSGVNFSSEKPFTLLIKKVFRPKSWDDLEKEDVSSYSTSVEEYRDFLKEKVSICYSLANERPRLISLLETVLPKINFSVPQVYMQRFKKNYWDQTSYTVKDRPLALEDVLYARPEKKIEKDVEDRLRFFTFHQMLLKTEEFSEERMKDLLHQESEFLYKSLRYSSHMSQVFGSASESMLDNWISEKVCYLWLKERVQFQAQNLTLSQSVGYLLHYI